VEPRLRQSGSRVYAPSLTGMGERSHLSQHLGGSATKCRMGVGVETVLSF